MNKDLHYYKIKDIPFFHVMGRNVKNAGKTDNPLVLFWTASGIEVRLKTSEIWVDIESHYDLLEPWLSIRFNNKQIARFIVPEGRHLICIMHGCSDKNANTIEVIKDTQAMAQEPRHSLQIHGFSVSEHTEFLPVQEKKFKFEFVGDSITTGEGLQGAQKEVEWIPAWLATDKNYARLFCQKYNADLHIVSQSGWGVVSAWDNNPRNIIPPYYDEICGVEQGSFFDKCGAHEKNDFTDWRPDAVIINLGTNDDAAFNNKAFEDSETGISYQLKKDEKGIPCKNDSEKFMKGVSDFIKHVRKCNPSSYILWVWGMCPIMLGKYINIAVENYKKETGDKKTGVLELPSMELEEDDDEKGSRFHPGPGTHKKAVSAIADYFSKYMDIE